MRLTEEQIKQEKDRIIAETIAAEKERIQNELNQWNDLKEKQQRALDSANANMQHINENIERLTNGLDNIVVPEPFIDPDPPDDETENDTSSV